MGKTYRRGSSDHKTDYRKSRERKENARRIDSNDFRNRKRR